MADEKEEQNNDQENDQAKGDQNDQDQEEFMSMDEVMGELGVDKDDLEQMVSQGKLRAYRSDNEMKFREEDLSSLEDSGQLEALSESDRHQAVSDDAQDKAEEEMTDIGDTADQEMDVAEEEAELDLDDIDVEDDELEELAEDLMLDEEESDQEEEQDDEQEDADEEIIFEEENVSATADETGDEAIELDPDELDEGPADSSPDPDTTAADSGKTMKMDGGPSGKSLDEDSGSGQKTQRKQTRSSRTTTSKTRSRTTRRSSTQTARRQRKSAAGTKTQLSKIWIAVLVIGVIISLEGLLIGVDMARISTASDQKQVEPWATSAPAEFMLDMASDRTLKGGSQQGSNTSPDSSSSTSGE